MYIKIMKLDSNANVVELARVVLVDGKAVLPGGWEKLPSIVGVDPEDGIKFMKALPTKLWGDRLWATLPIAS